MSTARIQLRGDTAANWAASNPILAERELVIETDTLKYKVGNGILDWNSLPYGGVTGAAGSSGTSGTSGTSGVDGPAGSSGSSGISGSSGTSGTAGSSGTSGIVPTNVYYDMHVAASDETTNITAGATKVTFYSPIAWTLTGVTATLTTSGSTTTTVDVNYNGSTVFSSPITLASGVFFNSSATTTSSIAQNGRFTVDIDGAGTNAKGLKVILTGNKTI